MYLHADTYLLKLCIICLYIYRTGRGISAMQRLMDLDNYTTMMLSTQYRMHPEILSFPNKQFYNNQLITSNSVYQRTTNTSSMLTTHLLSTTKPSYFTALTSSYTSSHASSSTSVGASEMASPNPTTSVKPPLWLKPYIFIDCKAPSNLSRFTEDRVSRHGLSYSNVFEADSVARFVYTRDVVYYMRIYFYKICV